MWPGPRRYIAFFSGVQAQDAVKRVVGKGGVDNDGRVGIRVAADGDKVWDGRVRHRVAVNGDKVWLAWSDHIAGMVFVKGRGGQGSSPRRGRGRALLGPQHY